MINKIREKIIKKTNEGFTLIESLVAITILLVSVVAPLSLAQQGIVASRLSQSQIVAYYLAQEGIELVKNVRDQNRLQNSNNQIEGALEECLVNDQDMTLGNAAGCTVDSTKALNNFGDSAVDNNCGTGCPNLTLPADGDGLYDYTGAVNTLFSREIKIWYPGEADKDNPSRTEEVIVESKVTWELANVPQTYFIRNNLLDW